MPLRLTTSWQFHFGSIGSFFPVSRCPTSPPPFSCEISQPNIALFVVIANSPSPIQSTSCRGDSDGQKERTKNVRKKNVVLITRNRMEPKCCHAWWNHKPWPCVPQTRYVKDEPGDKLSKLSKRLTVAWTSSIFANTFRQRSGSRNHGNVFESFISLIRTRTFVVHAIFSLLFSLQFYRHWMSFESEIKRSGLMCAHTHTHSISYHKI